MGTAVAAARSPPYACRRRPVGHVHPRSPGGWARPAVRRAPMVEKAAGRSLVMEEVTILKRGEAIRLPGDPSDEVVYSPTGRLGPEPEILPRNHHLRAVSPGKPGARTCAYAGACFISSPSPSSVPFPTSIFPKEKSDLATKGLRFLLRLDVA